MDFKENDCAKTLDQMDLCSVRDWVGTNSTIVKLEKAGKEMKQVWRLKGNMGLANWERRNFSWSSIRRGK